jgi:hypothetical protein
MKLELIDKIYVCHYTKLVERVFPLKEQLDKYKLDTEWILSNDKENIDIEFLKKEFVNIDNFFQLSGHYRKLKLSEISLLLKHIDVWKDIKYNNIKNALLLIQSWIKKRKFVI